MALTFVSTIKQPRDGDWQLVAAATLSSSYTQGTGENMATFRASVPDLHEDPAIKPASIMISAPSGYKCIWDRTGDKMLVYIAGGSELPTGAYPAALTGASAIEVTVNSRIANV